MGTRLLGLITCAITWVVTVCSAEHAIPDQLVTAHTVSIIKFDVTQWTQGDILDATRALIDEKELGEAGEKFDTKVRSELDTVEETPFDRLFAAGVEEFVVVAMLVPVGDVNQKQTFALIPITAGDEGGEAVQRAALRSLINDLGQSPILGITGLRDLTISIADQHVSDDRIDRWFVAYEGALPTEWSPYKQKQYNAAFQTLGTHALTWAMVMNFPVKGPFSEQLESIRPKADEQKKGMEWALEWSKEAMGESAADALVGARWYGGSLDLGFNVNLTFSAGLAQPEDAAVIKTGWDLVLPGLLRDKATEADKAAREAAEKKGQEIKHPTAMEFAEHLIAVLGMRLGEGTITIELTNDELRDTLTMLVKTISNLYAEIVQDVFDEYFPDIEDE